MTANKVVLDASDTEAEMDDIAATGQFRQVVHITLVCDNVTVSGEELYDALDYLKETVVLGNATDTEGSVTSDYILSGEKNTMGGRGTYIFNFGPA